MVRIGIFLFLSTIGLLYFFKIEYTSIKNDLVCTFSAPNTEKINETYQAKFRKLLPNNFPEGRFKHLSEKILSRPDTHQPLVCDTSENLNYRQAVFYPYRSQLYPVFTDSLDTLDWIAVSHHKENMLLNQLGKFKQVILQEKSSFENFSADCTVIREISDQIKLLEKHLKIDQQKRNPSQTKKTTPPKGPTILVRLHKSISRQLDFAKRHLQSNEKLFITKWKRFLDFESEKNLCPY